MKTKKRWGRKGFALFLALLLALSPAAAFAEGSDDADESQPAQAVEETKASEPETKAETQEPETKSEVTEAKDEAEGAKKETKAALESAKKDTQTKAPVSKDVSEKAPVKEQTKNNAEKEQVPQVVKTFLNAVQRLAGLGKMTEENAEQFNALGQAAMDAYEAVQNAGLENYEGVQEALATLMQIADSATGGVETTALISGEQFRVNVVKVVNGNIADIKTLTSICLQSGGHSGYVHSTNLRTLANQSGFSGYKGYNWSPFTTVPSRYTSGLCPNNNYASVHYNITGSAPYKANETLFLFFEDSKTFTLKYDANGGSGGPGQQTATSAASSYTFTIATIQPTRNGYDFLGWSTSPTATSPSYYGGGNINVTGTTTLYAVWKQKEPEKVTLVYDGNGNTGGTAPTSETVEKGTDVTIKNQGSLERQGYTFLGWNIDKNATVADFRPGDTMKLSVNTTLYAVWKEETLSVKDAEYIVQWYDTEGNMLKEPEVRKGTIGDTVSVTDADKEIEGYTFDANNQGNILTDTLKADGTVLRLYFTKDEEPTNPTDPIDPTEPTDPTDPINPTDPSDPTEPTDPTDPVNPTDPSEPTEPTDPTDPGQPTDPTEPVDPTEPTEPVGPTEPTTPVRPTDPTGPVEPIGPTNPSTPTDPVGPTDPTDPGNPTIPTDPITPSDPTGPEDPADPSDPADPTEPTTPVIPVGPTIPTDPGSPSGPDTPNTPADSNGPAGTVEGTTAVANVATVTPTAIPAVAALVPADAAAPAAVGLPDDTVPLAGQEAQVQEDPELTELDDDGVPLAKGSSGAWALLNFALMNLAIFECLMLLIGYFIKTKGASEEEEEEKKKLKKKGVMRIISLPIAAVSILAFCLTEDITLPTAFVDQYTLLMAIIALVQTAAVVLSRKELKDETEDEMEEKAVA